MGRSDKGRKEPPSGAPGPSKRPKGSHVRFEDSASSKPTTRESGVKTPGPKGSGKVREMLRRGQEGLTLGGAAGTFTPMYLVVAQKPLK